MRKLFVDRKYYLNVPDWFIDNRYNGIKEFLPEKNCFLSTEIQEYKSMKEIMVQFPKDSVFLDIGAQMGLSTIPIAAEGYKVIAVEPVRNNIDLLMRNIQENNLQNLVAVYPFAASDVPGEIEIYVPTEEDCASFSQEAAFRVMKPVFPEKITKVVLDNEIPKIINVDKITFIKVDVQGAEYEVLRGMKNILSRPQVRYILLEWDPQFMKLFGYTPEEFHEFLESLGYHRVAATVSDSNNVQQDLIYTNEKD